MDHAFSKVGAGMLTSMGWVLSFAMVWVFLAPQAEAVQFLPHRATYELKAKVGAGTFGQASGAVGVLSYELADGCDGWTVNQKAGIRLIGAEGDAHEFDWSQSTWEAKDGGGLRYSIREARDGELSSQRRGEVSFPNSSAPGTLTTELPERRESAIDPALLPMEHSTAIMEQAQTGSPVFIATVFDPSLADHPVEISAIITGATTTWQGKGEIFPELKGQMSRRVDLAFFVDNQPDSAPDFEQSLRVYDNGVVGELTFEFGGLQVEGVLRKLEVLPSENCP